MTDSSSQAKDIHKKLTTGFKIYGGLLWAIFLVGTILIPSLMGASDEAVKQLASRSFVILLLAYFIPYFISWKIFERKFGRFSDESHNN